MPMTTSRVAATPGGMQVVSDRALESQSTSSADLMLEGGRASGSAGLTDHEMDVLRVEPLPLHAIPEQHAAPAAGRQRGHRALLEEADHASERDERRGDELMRRKVGEEKTRRDPQISTEVVYAVLGSYSHRKEYRCPW